MFSNKGWHPLYRSCRSRQNPRPLRGGPLPYIPQSPYSYAQQRTQSRLACRGPGNNPEHLNSPWHIMPLGIPTGLEQNPQCTLSHMVTEKSWGSAAEEKARRCEPKLFPIRSMESSSSWPKKGALHWKKTRRVIWDSKEEAPVQQDSGRELTFSLSLHSYAKPLLQLPPLQKAFPQCLWWSPNTPCTQKLTMIKGLILIYGINKERHLSVKPQIQKR